MGGAGKHVVLIGMMASGKSTVGRALARLLDRPLLDSDAMVQARTGQTVAAIFAERGESAFRAEETAVLAEAVASPTPAVIAAAGGSVLDPANRKALAGAGFVVWLRADPAVLARRVGGGTDRPLLGHDPAAALRRLAAERDPLYAEVADLVIDVDASAVDDTVQTIVAALVGPA